ncbi:MAG TPA: hypothetical protein VG937_15530 [Polyangiaceae bacterium]|nr:hypothetical protein [Polyangiaceae bacterium]
MATTDAQARSYASQGFLALFGRPPSDSEVLMLMGVGRLETSYGDGWKGAGKGSFNMGAIIAGKSWTGDVFESRDSYPDSQGVNHWYVTKFRKYPAPEVGWQDLAHIVYETRPSVLAAATHGSSLGVSQALYRTHYYAGFGKTEEERVQNHHRILDRCVRVIAKGLGVPAPGEGSAAPGELKVGSRGDLVRAWQRNLGVVADGIFGQVTRAATVQWQEQHGVLPADGVVRAEMWKLA